MMTATITRERSLAELPAKFRAIVDGGDDFTNHGYATKFQARKAVLVVAIRLGWTYEDCHRRFIDDPTLPGWELWGSGRSEIGPTGRTKRLQEDYRQASAFIASHPAPVHDATSARSAIHDLTARSAEWDWHGVAGRTDRDVLAALHRKGKRLGSLTFHASARDLALDSGVSRATAERSLIRLADAGWIKRAGKDKTWLTGTYVLGSPGVTQTEPYKDSEVVVSYMARSGSLASHETWVSLGKSALAAWLALAETPRSAREVARRAGIGNGTAQRALQRLLTADLAADDAGWVRGTATPDDAAQRFGFDTVAKRKETYARERAAWDKSAQLDDMANGNSAANKSYMPTVSETSEHLEIHTPDPSIADWNRRAYEKRDRKAKAA